MSSDFKARLDGLNEGSATARVEACISRIEAEDGRLHSVARLFADAARSRAQQLDRAVADGAPRGPLHGLPVLVKELIDIEGIPTDFGSLAYATAPAAATAPALKRLEDAGAILLGTTHMVEFAIGSWGTNHAKGTPWNPADRDTHRVAGGSSSGSAVAVAAGLAPVAIGSDTGGSIRIPATLCGVVGFKPTYDLISREGVAPLGPSFDTLGPIARTVEDARLVTEAMAGVDLSHPPVAVAELKIARVSEAALPEMSSDVAIAYAQGLDRLAAAGARIEEIDLPLSFVDFQTQNGDIVAYEAYRHLIALVDDPATPLDPYVRKRVLAGRGISDELYRQRLAEMAATRRTFEERFAGFDLLVLPGTPIRAATTSEVKEDQIPMSRYTRAANCLNLCGISLPLTRPVGELPVGLQLCARAGSDAFLLAAAASVEPAI